MTIFPVQGLVPPAVHPFLPREEVVAKLVTMAERLLVLAAPAGSGKSMALLAFSQADGACHWTDPEGLDGAPHSGTLILDQLLWPADPHRQGALMASIRARLPRQRIMMALRQGLPQPLRDEWIAGRAAVINADDLMFRQHEAAALFGTAQAPREVQLLHPFTYGWPLGLGLLSRDPDQALALMRRDGARLPLPRSLTLWFDDWLQSNLEARAQSLLMDLAIFEQFPAAVVEALPALPGQSGGLRLLAALRDQGLFLRDHDKRPGWFSLMPVFARYLRDRVALAHPDRAAAIRRFAVEWSASTHDAPAQLRHGLAVWSRDEAIARVDAAGAIAVSLATGPDIALEQPISAATALTAPLTFFGMIYERIRLGAFDEARVHYENALALTNGFTQFDSPQDPDQIRDWIKVFSAVIQISADTPIDPIWRASFEADLRLAISRDPVLAMAQSTVMMLMALNAGAVAAALAVARLALQLQDRGREDKAAIFVHLHRASALIAAARLEEAKAAIRPAQKLAADHSYADSYEMISCQIHAGLCAFESGEADRARALLAPCYDHLPRIHGWRRNWLDYFSALAELDHLSKAGGGADLWIARGLDFAALRNQPQLALGLELIGMDLALRMGQLPSGAFETLVQRLLATEHLAPQILHLAQIVQVEALLLQGLLPEAAACFAALDRGEIAAHDLRLELRAASIGLDLARLAGDAEGMATGARAVVELAQRLPRLARLPQIQDRLRMACDMLLAQGRDPGRAVLAFQAAFAARSRSLLSPRESQIIAMITEGLSNKEMARVLGSSEGTIKSHRKNLYEKLNVSSRSKAIARAKDLGLVQGK